MNGLQIKLLSKYQAESAFLAENAADFPIGSKTDVTTRRFNELIGEIQILAARQGSLVVRQNRDVRKEALSRLVKMLQRINRAAQAMADEVYGIKSLFRMPKKRLEKIWLATARTYHQDSEPYEAEFIDYDLPATFRSDLQALTNELEQLGATTEMSLGQRGAATSGLSERFAECKALSNKLNVIISNKYHENTEKLAAWTIISHANTRMKRARETPSEQAKTGVEIPS